jgi:hypothetical protein
VSSLVTPGLIFPLLSSPLAGSQKSWPFTSQPVIGALSIQSAGWTRVEQAPHTGRLCGNSALGWARLQRRERPPPAKNKVLPKHVAQLISHQLAAPVAGAQYRRLFCEAHRSPGEACRLLCRLFRQPLHQMWHPRPNPALVILQETGRADRLRVMTSDAENHAPMWFMFCVLSSDVTPDSHAHTKDGNETRDASQTSICQSRPKYCLSVDSITDAKLASHPDQGAADVPEFRNGDGHQLRVAMQRGLAIQFPRLETTMHNVYASFCALQNRTEDRSMSISKIAQL